VLQISELFTPVVTDLLRYLPFISLSDGNGQLSQLQKTNGKIFKTVLENA